MSERSRKKRTILAKLLLILLLLSLIPSLITGYFTLRTTRDMSIDSVKNIKKIENIAISANSKALTEQSKKNLRQLVLDKAKVINLALSKIESDTKYAAHYAINIFENKSAYNAAFNNNDYLFDDRGVYGRIEPKNHHNKSQIWVNNQTSITDDMKKTIAISEHLDYIYISIKERSPTTDWIYTTFENKLMRIYPWFNNNIQPTGDWDPSSYIFYTAANPENNPDKKTVWVDPYIDTAGSGWMVTCSIPLYNKKGNFLGVQSNDITLKSFVNNILSISVGRSGYAFMIDKNGNTIAFPERANKDLRWPATQDKEIFNLLETPKIELRNAIKKMVMDKSGLSTVSLMGMDKYIAYAPIKTTGWSIGVIIPKKEIIEPSLKAEKEINIYVKSIGDKIRSDTQNMLSNFITIIIFTIIIVSIIAIFVARYITKPIIILSKSAEKIGKGDLSFKIETKGNNEIKHLARSFNTMTAKLKSSYAKLEQKIVELENSNKFNQTLIENIPASVWMSDENGKCIFINKEYTRLLGYEKNELLGLYPDKSPFICKTGLPYLTDGTITYLNKMQKYIIDNRIVGEGVIPFIRKDGKIVVHQCIEIPYGKGKSRLWASLDITEIIKHEIELGKTISTLGSTLSKVSSGDLSVKVDLNAIPKEFRPIGENINTTIESLKALVTTDSLTHLFNRRIFYQLMSLKERYGSIIMMDIDDFKHINDTYGHDTGDEVLKKAAQILLENARDGDMPIRWGGDELLLYLPRTNIAGAIIIAKRIKSLIKKEDFTLSFGVACGELNNELIKAADNALYKSKDSGKNKISSDE